MPIYKTNETDLFLTYDFEYKGFRDTSFMYELTGELFTKLVKHYFESEGVLIKGSDNHVWNAIIGLNATDTIFESEIDWAKEEFKDYAYEAFKEECEENYYDELDDYIDPYEND